MDACNQPPMHLNGKNNKHRILDLSMENSARRTTSGPLVRIKPYPKKHHALQQHDFTYERAKKVSVRSEEKNIPEIVIPRIEKNVASTSTSTKTSMAVETKLPMTGTVKNFAPTQVMIPKMKDYGVSSESSYILLYDKAVSANMSVKAQHKDAAVMAVQQSCNKAVSAYINVQPETIDAGVMTDKVMKCSAAASTSRARKPRARKTLKPAEVGPAMMPEETQHIVISNTVGAKAQPSHVENNVMLNETTFPTVVRKSVGEVTNEIVTAYRKLMAFVDLTRDD